MEDGGAILRADIGTLAVQRRRVVNGEEDVEEIAIGDDARVEGDLHRFGVPRLAAAYLLVGGIRHAAADVSGNDALHASQLPVQASLQHTPSTQWPEVQMPHEPGTWQSVAVLQAWPVAREG